jgi:hypothetical protein
MKEKNLYEIMQNSAVGAIAMQSFVLGYYNSAKNEEADLLYPRLWHLFYVLPIAYNEHAMNAFQSSRKLYTAINTNRDVILGLQDRANKMSSQTFDSLNLAFSKQILAYNRIQKTIELPIDFKKRTPLLPLLMNRSDNRVKEIKDCSRKLGGVFAKVNEKNLQIHLNIRF